MISTLITQALRQARLSICFMIFAFLLIGCSRFSTDADLISSEALLTKADTLYAEAEYAEALDYYLLAAESSSDDAEIFYKIGRIYGIKHSRGEDRLSVLAGKRTRLSRVKYRDDSNYNNAVYYFRKAAELGHLPSRELLRTLYNNIQHQDVKY